LLQLPVPGQQLSDLPGRVIVQARCLNCGNLLFGRSNWQTMRALLARARPQLDLAGYSVLKESRMKRPLTTEQLKNHLDEQIFVSTDFGSTF
jgi:hypothetical protein